MMSNGYHTVCWQTEHKFKKNTLMPFKKRNGQNLAKCVLSESMLQMPVAIFSKILNDKCLKNCSRDASVAQWLSLYLWLRA